MHSNTDDGATRGIEAWRLGILLGVVLLSVAIVPAAATAHEAVPTDSHTAESDTGSEICDTQIDEYLEGFMQITTILGLVGLVAVWQVDTLAEMLTMNPSQKRKLKEHKRSAAKAAVVLVLLGPLFTVMVNVMGLGMGTCFDLTGFI